MLINRWEPRICRELSKRAPALNSFLIHIDPYSFYLSFSSFFSMAVQPTDSSSGVVIVRFPSVQPCGNSAARDADGVDRTDSRRSSALIQIRSQARYTHDWHCSLCSPGFSRSRESARHAYTRILRGDSCYRLAVYLNRVQTLPYFVYSRGDR